MNNKKIKRDKKGCEKEGCKNWAMHHTTLCRVHHPDLPPSSMNYPKIKCSKEGCKSWAMHDTTFCRQHNTDLPPNGFQPGNEFGFQPGNNIGNQFQPGNKIGFQPQHQLSRKHGFYAKYMTEEEEKFLQEELEQPQEIGFEEIIALTKLGITRALKSGETDPMYKMISLLAKIKLMQLKASQNEGNNLTDQLDKILTEMGLGESSAE